MKFSEIPAIVFEQEILSHMDPTDSSDRQCLMNLSLVARKWREPCQSLLFESVQVSPENLRLRQGKISQNQSKLLPRVRRLIWNRRWSSYGEPHWQLGPTDASLCHSFSLLTRLEQFKLIFCSIPLPACELELFSGFKDTVSHLILSRCTVQESALFTFINCFPNLELLSFNALSYVVDSEGFSCSPRRLKKLSITPDSREFQGFLSKLSKQWLSFEEVAIGPGHDFTDWEEIANGVVRVFGDGVEHLRVAVHPDQGGSLTLSLCRELRVLEFTTSGFNTELDIVLGSISSITSTKIEKIRINRSQGYKLRDDSWLGLNDALDRLVERQGCGGRLEVELRGDWDIEKACTYLPGHVEGGRVKVWNEPVCFPDEFGRGRG